MNELREKDRDARKRNTLDNDAESTYREDDMVRKVKVNASTFQTVHLILWFSMIGLKEINQFLDCDNMFDE